MELKPAAFLRTTLPLALEQLEDFDSGRYHSLWLPDHMVSFWPDSIWTPEFTDLAKASPSPHRHLDAMAIAAAAAVKTQRVPIATSVVDTSRRHPAMLAQTALTLSHLSKGRFILGLGSGEIENNVSYGFDFEKPVGRFEEAIKVIRLLWDSDSPVDFDGQFFKLEAARMDTEAYEGEPPPIWLAGAGPRTLRIIGKYADGWWPAGAWTPEDYAAKLAVIRESAERHGRDPFAITPAFIITCLIGDDDEIDAMLQAPLVRAWVLQASAAVLADFGFEHPMGPGWRGFVDINPSELTRERMLDFLARVDPACIRAVLPTGTPEQVARTVKGFVDAGLRVPKILDYGGMAGLDFAARSPAKVRAVEDELMRLCGMSNNVGSDAGSAS